MWLYYCLDVIPTLTEAMCLYIFSRCLLKKNRFSGRRTKVLMLVLPAILAWGFTWFSELGAYKVPILVLSYIVLLKILYKDNIYQVITVEEITLLATSVLPECLGIIIANWIFGNELFILVEGHYLLRWEGYIISFTVRVLVFFMIYVVVKNFQYEIMLKDCLILTLVFGLSFIVTILYAYNYMNLGKSTEVIVHVSASILAGIFFAIFLYSKNALYLREQEEKNKIQIAQLQQQFAYYQEKLKDEEKVRSVYHDMKNHLLVLQRQINSPETAEMVEKIQSQVAVYENYEHTGNDILDIILKEKLEKAREKHITLSVAADLNGVDFIEPLDISTIFGNGLDNAIEASEKLPEEQRAILVKAGKMQNFFSVLIENNCLQDSGNTKCRTTKSDDFLHGFGISNMRKAAEKYGGQLTAKCENGRFILKILLPIPERLEV